MDTKITDKQLEDISTILNAFLSMDKGSMDERYKIKIPKLPGSCKDLQLSKKNNYIASRSKILSFMNPENYAICDSFLTRNKQDNNFIQFSPPDVRNGICKSFNLSYLTNKLGLTSIKPIKKYEDFIEFLKMLTAKIKPAKDINSICRYLKNEE